MMWAAFTLGFFAFLRCSEFTYPGVHSFSSKFNLTKDCVTFCPSLVCPQRLLVTLKSSKTDSFRAGQSLVIARCPSLLCPVSAMQQYFLLANPRSGPLFYFQSGRYLTWSSVTHLLRDSARSAGLPHESLKGHSFRIGAASATAAAGLPDWLIKVLGRWSSHCYQLYIRTPESVLLSAAPKMASVSGDFLYFGLALGGCMPCMHLWRLSLRSDFSQALALLVSCHLISLPLSCLIQPLLCWGDKKGSANTLVLFPP